jgi:hypothetical protein
MFLLSVDTPYYWHNTFTLEQINTLSALDTNQGIKDVRWSLKPFKFPGPNGFHHDFFQNIWTILGGSFYDFVKNSFQERRVP